VFIFRALDATVDSIKKTIISGILAKKEIAPLRRE